jgi:hypothetical protein
LFPGAELTTVTDADLVVIAAVSSELPACARATVQRCRPDAQLWLYSIDAGRVDVVTPSDLRHWYRRNTAVNRALSWARTHPARWRTVGRVAELLP